VNSIVTSIFSDTETTRVFGIPPGCDFSVSFLNGLKRRLAGHPPDAIARTEIFTNTRRAQRRWEEVLIDGQAALLPQIKVITDLARDVRLRALAQHTETPLARQLTIMQAVRKLLESGTSLAPRSAAFDLAGSLQTLFDEMDGEGISAEALNNLDISDHSEHWQTALRFLRILDDASLTSGTSGPEARQRQAVENLSTLWAQSPPDHPVLIAGSTGSRGTTAHLMDAVLKLPQGALILPGFDFNLDPTSWSELEQQTDGAIDHPQFGFAQLAKKLGFDIGAVSPWADDDTPQNQTRNALISLAMRPAPVTDQWISEGPSHEHALPTSTQNLTLLEAPNERFEASAIAIALREAVETGKRAALITPDATLSRRVTADLERWGIIPDDSAGVPLRFTPPAIFLNLIAQTKGALPETAGFLAILKHPLCATGWDRRAHLHLTRKLDVEKLRDIGPRIDWTVLEDWAEKVEAAQVWINWLKSVFAGLDFPDHSTLEDYLGRHRSAASQLAKGPLDGADDDLWDKKAGETVSEILDTLRSETDAAGQISKFDYLSIFRAQIGTETVREEGFLPDKRVAIWGQLEARVQSADLIVLGGLNEGIWPKLPAPDPWLSRAMRKDVGLQLPERRIGLSAHDFQQAIANADVILSRSEKVDNTPTVPSRWLTRLDNLLQGIGDTGKSSLLDMRTRGKRLVALAQLIDTPETRVNPEPRPCPAPAITTRPDQISVTQVERLIRDPYSIYADKILRLRPLPELGRSANARDRGTSFHKVFEAYIDAIRDEIPPDAREIFDEIATTTLTQKAPWPSERRIWRGRLLRIADSFIAREADRRKIAAPAHTELKGRIPIPGFSRPLALTCRADRIDIAQDGSVAIYDYKSSIPTDRVQRLFSKQLELEAYMSLHGGFEEMRAARATHLEIIGLSKPGSYDERDPDPDLVSEIWDDFLKIIAHFEAPDHGYTARLRPMFEADWGDYDHLARRGEWEDNEDPIARPVP